MATQKKREENSPADGTEVFSQEQEELQKLKINEKRLLDQNLVNLQNNISDLETPSLIDNKSVESKAALEVVTKRTQAMTSLLSGVLMPDNVLNKIKRSKGRHSPFDPAQLVRLEDGPKVLAAVFQTEFDIAPAKLRKIVENLDPRIIIDVEGELFFDKALLADAFSAYLQSQQDKSVFQMSRSSRAALRRNIILRETSTFLEQILRKDTLFQEHLTKRINLAFGDLYKHMQDDDVLAFLVSFRINEEKRRLRAQETELERLAIEQLEQLEANKRL